MIKRVLVAACLWLPGASGLAAQAPGWDPGRVYATRAGLDSLLHRLDQSAQSPAYSPAVRDRARLQGEAIRERLARGDYQAGDRILLVVEREPTLSDTFTVAEGPVVLLPQAGRISLDGVLRSELEPHLTREIGRVVRDPELRARTLIRISVIGEVGSPGFYQLESELVLTDVLARAGQVTRDADLGRISVERGGRIVWDATALGPEIIEGRTLDQLGVRAGDRIIVGRRPSFSWLEGGARTILLIVSLPVTLIALFALF
jgi:protein involved in polysaccharide export with SLBB domain